MGLDRIDLAFVDAVGQVLGDLGDFCLADVSLGDGERLVRDLGFVGGNGVG